MDQLKKIYKFIFTEIVYNGHLQTVGSLAIAIFAAQLLNIKISWDFLSILYLAFYIIYTNDRYRGMKTDVLTNSTRTQHVKSFARFIPYLLIASVIVLAMLLYRYSTGNAAIFISAITFFGFLYPIYFKNLTKKIPLFKNFYVSFVFTLLVLSPVIYYSIPLSNMIPTVSIIMLFAFSRGFMMQIFLDLKDIESDKGEGLKTLGTLIGKEKVYKILTVVNIVTALFLPIIYFMKPQLVSSSVLPILLLIPFAEYYFYLAKNQRFQGFIIGSSEFIPWPILIYLGELIKR